MKLRKGYERESSIQDSCMLTNNKEEPKCGALRSLRAIRSELASLPHCPSHHCPSHPIHKRSGGRPPQVSSWRTHVAAPTTIKNTGSIHYFKHGSIFYQTNWASGVTTCKICKSQNETNKLCNIYLEFQDLSIHIRIGWYILSNLKSAGSQWWIYEYKA